MRNRTLTAFLFGLVLMVFSFGLRAQAATEPSVQQIYATANRGDLQQANTMIDEVIAHHPGSAKAHYVKAELAARGKDAATAKAELQKAEQLSPGLGFAKPEAVSALRSQISAMSGAPRTGERSAGTRTMGAAPTDPAPARTGGGFSLSSLLVPALIVIGVLMFVRSRRARQAPVQPMPGPMPGPNDFGRYPQQPDYYPPQGGPGMYPPPGYPQREGMGSSIARGLGTGLAIGAGAAVASEIGHRIFDHNGNEVRNPAVGAGGDNANSPLARDAGLGNWADDPSLNRDMGGQDFGIQDGGGWDDGGGGFGGGGDDWDNN